MSIRYWTMAAFTLGAVLLLPGVVFASGNGHQSVHGSHPADKSHGQVQHQDNHHGESNDSHGKNQSEAKNRTQDNSGSEVSESKQKSREEHSSQSAEHANQHARQHAADASAVQQTVDHSQQNTGHPQHHEAAYQQKQKKPKNPADLIHNDSGQKMTEPKVVQKTESEKPAKPLQPVTKQKLSPQVHQTLSKKKASPNQSWPGKIQKPEPQPMPKRQPEPAPDPQPMAILSLSSTVSGSKDHPQPRKGQGYGTQGMSLGIAPDWLNHTGVSVQSFITQRTQYGNQWINAPPSPPPKNLLLFQNQAF